MPENPSGPAAGQPSRGRFSYPPANDSEENNKVKTRRTTLAYLLLAFMFAPLAAWAEYTEGVEYIEVPRQPVETGAKIEVREFFWYGCPHCYHLEPVLASWRKTLTPKAEFVRSPAIFRDTWGIHARAYFALQALGMAEKLDSAVFKAIHEQNRFLDSETDLTAFMVEQGVDEKRFSDAFHSFSMEKSLKRAVELQKLYSINSVPTFVVDGRYLTSPALTHGNEEVVKVLDFLIAKAAKERKKNPAPR
jgi:thiol:disulfide interchange protein DsbA